MWWLDATEGFAADTAPQTTGAEALEVRVPQSPRLAAASAQAPSYCRRELYLPWSSTFAYKASV